MKHIASKILLLAMLSVLSCVELDQDQIQPDKTNNQKDETVKQSKGSSSGRVTTTWTTINTTVSRVTILQNGNVTFYYDKIALNPPYAGSAQGKQEYRILQYLSGIGVTPSRLKATFEIRNTGPCGGAFSSSGGTAGVTTSWVAHTIEWTTGNCFLEAAGGSFPGTVELRYLQFYYGMDQCLTPTAPSALTLSYPSNNVIKVNWTDNSNNEDEFWIYRKRDDEVSFTKIGTAAENAVNYTDNTATDIMHTYTYYVLARNVSTCNLSSSPTSQQTGRPHGVITYTPSLSDFTIQSGSPSYVKTGTTVEIGSGDGSSVILRKADFNSAFDYTVCFDYDYALTYFASPLNHTDVEFGVQISGQTTINGTIWTPPAYSSSTGTVVSDDYEYNNFTIRSGPISETKIYLRDGTSQNNSTYVSKGANFCNSEFAAVGSQHIVIVLGATSGTTIQSGTKLILRNFTIQTISN